MGTGGAQRLNRREQRLRPHDHARSPAVRIVVHRPMAPDPLLAQVMHAELDEAGFDRAADDRGPQRSGDQLREDA